MKKVTIRLEDDVWEAIDSKCERHGDLQWLINKALKAAYCKKPTPKNNQQKRAI